MKISRIQLSLKSLKTKIFLLLISLGILCALGSGLVMYLRYNNYVKQTYTETLTKVLTMIDKQYPVFSDFEQVMKDDVVISDAYWEIAKGLNAALTSFNLAYLYFLERKNGEYMLLTSADVTYTNHEVTPYGKPDEELVAAYNTRTLQITKHPVTNEWGTLVSAFFPVVKNGQVVGILGADYDISFVKTLNQQMRLELFLTLLISALGAGILAFSLSSFIVVPIKQVERVAGALADMNFTVDIQSSREDEIGNMQRALIAIRDNLHSAITELHDHLLKMTTTGKEMNTVIVESSDSLGVINGNIDTVKTKVDSQMESVSQTSRSVTEIVGHIDSLDQAVQTQVSHITGSSAVIERMVANISSVRSVVTSTSKTTDTLSKSSATGHKMLLQLAEELKRIEEQSVTLQNANKTISDIAGQTNILAMNAAIEAAHAGEAGKGFAVVAGEIRKLAEMAEKESQGISQEIRKMEQAIGQIGRVSQETMGAMDMIFAEINAMGSSFSDVKRTVDEQAAGGEEILTALKGIQSMTVRVQDGTGAIYQRSGVIRQEVDKLYQISQEVTESMYEVRTASGSILSFLEQAKKMIVV